LLPDSISKHLFFKNFPGGACPQTPLELSNRSQELKPKDRVGNSNRVIFITRFSNVAPKVMGVIRKYWQDIQRTKWFKILNSLYLFLHLEKIII